MNNHQHPQPLTEAQRLFLQKYPQLEPDDPLVDMQAWNAALETEIKAFHQSFGVWTTAIQQQTQVAVQLGEQLSQQGLTLQATSKNNARLSQTLSPLKTTVEQLLQVSDSQTHTISRYDATLRSLSQDMVEIKRWGDRLNITEERLAQKIQIANDRMLWQWAAPLVLAVAIGGLCWTFGSVRGFNQGQLDVAGHWFNGVENADYWRQVRN
ncbi:MAG: hypothetical protein AAFW75_26950, partial [Cyanobacteria bacterium J06636_16]